MASRTTEDQVRAVAPDIDADAVLIHHMDHAALLMTNLKMVEPLLDADTLEMIETYLAAHGYTVGTPTVKTEGISGITENKAITVGMHLNGTVYGQQAIALDTSGTLARHQKALTAGTVGRTRGVTWLGTE